MKSKNKIPFASNSLGDLFSNSLFSSPSVSIRKNDTMADATGLLINNLESFTDSLVVTEGIKPVGFLGGIELLDGILKNPTSNFFSHILVGEMMNKDLTIVTKQTLLSDLINKWKKTRRATAIIKNQYGSYSAISARKLVELGTFCDYEIIISKIPKKNIITFDIDFTIGDIINSMFKNKTRKLVLKNTEFFISDRIIAEKIVRELDYLRNESNFLNLPVSVFKLEKLKTISDISKLSELCKIMVSMLHPYVMINKQLVTPWDIVTILGSKDLVNYNLQKVDN